MSDPESRRRSAPLIGAQWEHVEFVSDLHLDQADSPTFQRWQQYMASTSADAVIILGDLFEVWIGDDMLDCPGIGSAVVSVLRQVKSSTKVCFMAGNRDFLVGEAFLRASGVRLLDDPTCLELHGTRYLLTHGDQLCIDDIAYQAFRQTVRSSHWIDDFLRKPLPERQAIARAMRDASEARQTNRSIYNYADVDPGAACDWLYRADASVLIHGHTHRPGEHILDAGHRRVVLSDWDVTAEPPRAQILRVDRAGLHRQDLQ